MNIPEILITHDPYHVGIKAAEEFVRTTQHAVRTRGWAAVALSGGRTVRVLLERLATPPLVDLVPWDRTEIFWSDERLVPPEDPGSNHGTAIRELLEHVPIPRECVHTPPVGAGPADAVHEKTGKRLEQGTVRQVLDARGDTGPSLDLVFLGLGHDGHIASLFPGQSATWDRSRLVIPARGPDSPHERITFSPSFLLTSARLVVMVCGHEKAGIVQQVIEIAPDVESRPAQMLQEALGHVVWILDLEAASCLTPGPPSPDGGEGLPWW
ncbi:MAG: 6-phosphogluconolactonase [Candidatus Riflebacteria bacterium]|nr:6-phosphogluconolactonase [Candidatus Riflebacteria bacterium]